MKRLVIDYLNDIMEAIVDLESFSSGISFDEFKSNHMIRNAVIRSLEIIGEASKNIPDDLRKKHSEIPWKRMAGMRDKLIHGYFGVDYESVWALITERILEIKTPLNKMIYEQHRSNE